MKSVVKILCQFTISALLLAAPASADQVYYLVRHAEKMVSEDRDPPLTETGHARAQWLASYFADKGLTAIYSTKYQRTQQTAAPTAAETGHAIDGYDPRDLPGFAARLKQMQGTILIVGHSNTTPGLAGMLAEQPMEDLDERVYDHIYKVTVDDAGKATLNIDFSEPHTPLPESDGSTP